MKSKILYRLYRIILKHHNSCILDEVKKVAIGKWGRLTDPDLSIPIRTINVKINGLTYYTTAYQNDLDRICTTEYMEYNLRIPKKIQKVLLTYELTFRKAIVDKLL
jgi:hypothetical protein